MIPQRLSRRAWLAAAAGGLAAAGPLRADEPALGPAERREADAVNDIARKFGVGPMRAATPSAHYLGLGDAPPEFLAEAVDICEGLADDYLAHFKEKGFELTPPTTRLTLIAMADAKGFRAFAGDVEASVAGIYEVQTNRLVIFDNRPGGGALATRANTVALFHEATHQLTFNTGLLDRKADVPLCISEGLACYGEVRRPKGQVKLGALNKDRLKVFTPFPRLAQNLQFLGQNWIDLPNLLEFDRYLSPDDDEEANPAKQRANALRTQMAYAQSWSLIYYLMTTKDRLPAFQSYLKALRVQADPARRMRLAGSELGDLKALDGELRKAVGRWVRR